MSVPALVLIVGSSSLALLVSVIIFSRAGRSLGVQRDLWRLLGSVFLAGGLMIAAVLIRSFVKRLLSPSNGSADAIAVLGLFLTIISVYSIYLLTRFETDRKELEERLAALEIAASNLTQANSDYIESAKYNAAKMSAYIALSVLIDEVAGQDDVESNQNWIDMTLVQCLAARSSTSDIKFDLEGLSSIESAEPGRISGVLERSGVAQYFNLAYDEALLRQEMDISARDWAVISEMWAGIRPG